jgi:beta-lactamase class D
MKNLILNIVIISIFVFSCHCQINNKINTEKKMPEFEEILDNFQVKGSILIYDNKKEIYYSNDFNWAKEGNIPASTFKIPNSIIAIELGIVDSDTTILKWNGEKRYLEIWEQDLSFKQAFQLSCVPCYQEIARNIGYKRMKDYLEKFDYNEMIIDTLSIDKFWLEGNSKISQYKQIEFLRKFYFSELPVSERTVKIVKNIMEIEKSEKYILSGKTGWGTRKGNDNGWYVGFLETNENVIFFATNVIPNEDLIPDDFLSARINVTKTALKKLKLIK